MSIFSDIMTLLVSIYRDCVLLISPSTSTGEKDVCEKDTFEKDEGGGVMKAVWWRGYM